MSRSVRSRPLLAAWLLLEAHPWLAALLFTIPVGVGAFALIGLAVLLQTPTGPARVIDAEVVGLRLLETEFGTYPRARVRLPSGQEVTVRIPREEPCAVGDRIRIRETPVRWGRQHRATPGACAR